MTRRSKIKSKEGGTKHKVIMAAKDVFAERGFEGSSMSRIAARAGIDKSSLYYFFKNKEDLFAAVTVGVWKDLEGIVLKNLGSNKLKDGRKILSKACQEFIKTSTAAGLSMTRMELPRLGNPAFKEILAIIRNMQKRSEEFLLDQGVKNPQVAYVIISNAIHSYMLHCRLGKPQPSPKVYSDYLSSLFI
jgi:AcrR family transcriptional regulator